MLNLPPPPGRASQGSLCRSPRIRGKKSNLYTPGRKETVTRYAQVYEDLTQEAYATPNVEDDQQRMASFYQFQTDPDGWILSYSKPCHAAPPLSDSDSSSSSSLFDSDSDSTDGYEKLSHELKCSSSCLDNDGESTDKYALSDKRFVEPRRVDEEFLDHKAQDAEIDHIQLSLDAERHLPKLPFKWKPYEEDDEVSPSPALAPEKISF